MRKRIPLSTPLLPINMAALLKDPKENLKLEQIKSTHLGVMELLGDLGSPLYAEPLSMTEFFDAMIIRSHHIGEMPKQGWCKDLQMAAQVYEDEKQQVLQKILGCLDMRVLDGNFIVPMCLHTPTLILPPMWFRELYFNANVKVGMSLSFQAEGMASCSCEVTSRNLSSPGTLGHCLLMSARQ